MGVGPPTSTLRAWHCPRVPTRPRHSQCPFSWSTQASSQPWRVTGEQRAPLPTGPSQHPVGGPTTCVWGVWPALPDCPCRCRPGPFVRHPELPERGCKQSGHQPQPAQWRGMAALSSLPPHSGATGPEGANPHTQGGCRCTSPHLAQRPGTHVLGRARPAAGWKGVGSRKTGVARRETRPRVRETEIETQTETGELCREREGDTRRGSAAGRWAPWQALHTPQAHRQRALGRTHLLGR